MNSRGVTVDDLGGVGTPALLGDIVSLFTENEIHLQSKADGVYTLNQKALKELLNPGFSRIGIYNALKKMHTDNQLAHKDPGEVISDDDLEKLSKEIFASLQFQRLAAEPALKDEFVALKKEGVTALKNTLASRADAEGVDRLFLNQDQTKTDLQVAIGVAAEGKTGTTDALAAACFGVAQFNRLAAEPSLRSTMNVLSPEEKTALKKRFATFPDDTEVDKFIFDQSKSKAALRNEIGAAAGDQNKKTDALADACFGVAQFNRLAAEPNLKLTIKALSADEKTALKKYFALNLADIDAVDTFIFNPNQSKIELRNAIGSAAGYTTGHASDKTKALADVCFAEAQYEHLATQADLKNAFENLREEEKTALKKNLVSRVDSNDVNLLFLNQGQTKTELQAAIGKAAGDQTDTANTDALAAVCFGVAQFNRIFARDEIDSALKALLEIDANAKALKAHFSKLEDPKAVDDFLKDPVVIEETLKTAGLKEANAQDIAQAYAVDAKFQLMHAVANDNPELQKELKLHRVALKRALALLPPAGVNAIINGENRGNLERLLGDDVGLRYFAQAQFKRIRDDVVLNANHELLLLLDKHANALMAEFAKLPNSDSVNEFLSQNKKELTDSLVTIADRDDAKILAEALYDNNKLKKASNLERDAAKTLALNIYRLHNMVIEAKDIISQDEIHLDEPSDISQDEIHLDEPSDLDRETSLRKLQWGVKAIYDNIHPGHELYINIKTLYNQLYNADDNPHSLKDMQNKIEETSDFMAFEQNIKNVKDEAAKLWKLTNQFTNKDRGYTSLINLSNAYQKEAEQDRFSTEANAKLRLEENLKNSQDHIDRINIVIGILRNKSPVTPATTTAIQDLTNSRNELATQMVEIKKARNAPVTEVNTYSAGSTTLQLTPGTDEAKIRQIWDALGGGRGGVVSELVEDGRHPVVKASTEARIDPKQDYKYTERAPGTLFPKTKTKKVTVQSAVCDIGNAHRCIVKITGEANKLDPEQLLIIAGTLVKKYYASSSDQKRFAITSSIPPELARAISTYIMLTTPKYPAPRYLGKSLEITQSYKDETDILLRKEDVKVAITGSKDTVLSMKAKDELENTMGIRPPTPTR